MKAYKVYAIDRRMFTELVIEAASVEEAKAKYHEAWEAGEVEAGDYLDDVEYVVKEDE
jgi:hypothetical protein